LLHAVEVSLLGVRQIGAIHAEVGIAEVGKMDAKERYCQLGNVAEQCARIAS
jgi:hypothetical protein